jgi:hypothetical protein
LEESIEKKRFFLGERKTSGCVIVGMVTTVPAVFEPMIEGIFIQ